MISKTEIKSFTHDFKVHLESGKISVTQAEWVIDFLQAIENNPDCSLFKTEGPNDQIIKLCLMRDRDFDYRQIDMPDVAGIKSESDLVRVLEQAKNCLDAHVSLETKVRGSSITIGQWPTAFSFDEKFTQLESCVDKILQIRQNIDQALAQLVPEREGRVAELAAKIKETRCLKT